MSEEFTFKRYAGSSKGLRARPMLSSDSYATLASIFSIQYRVRNITDNTISPWEPLTVSDVMSAGLRKWTKDLIGYTFLWQAPGSLWPDPLKKYRIIVEFTPSDSLGNTDPDGAFTEVWAVETLDPLG